MAEVVHEFTSPVRGADNIDYVCRAYAEQRGHLWIGWLEFTGPRGVKKTGEETSQPNRDAVKYWATGLEVIYLEGALHRAK